MTDDRAPFADDEIEVLEDDLLEEATLDDDALGEGGFEEEATQVYDPGAGDAGFAEEATQVYDPSQEGELDDTDDGGFEEEATQVFQPAAQESSTRPSREPAPSASGGASPSILVSPAAHDDSADWQAAEPPEEKTVVTSSPAAPARAPLRQVASSAPQPAAPPPSRAPLMLVAVLLAGVLAALLMLRGGNDDESRATATLGIFSAPSGAALFVNGQPLEQRTPTSVPDLAVGESYEIQLRADGFEPLTETIEIVAAGPLAREYELQPILGTLIVRTFPEGATLSVDGDERGVSPLTLPELDRQRTYALAASLDGHEAVERSVRWDDATPNEQVVVLTLTPVLADEEIEQAAEEAEAEEQAAAQTASRPAASRTSSPRAARPATTANRRPATPTDEARARHLPAASPPADSPPASTRPSTRPSERPSARAAAPAPEPEPTFGQLSVQALPYGQVYVNNSMVAAETPLIGHRLETGVYSVKVFYVSLRSWSDERTVRIDADENRVLTFRAEP